MGDDNAVVKAQENLPAIYDYGEDAGRGFEGTTQAELQLPFLALLQDMSPQVTGEGDQGVPGAKAGLFFNTVTNELMSSFNFIPAQREHAYVEWKPRTQGGGFVARRLPDDPIVAQAIAASKEFGKYTTKEGNSLVDTIYLFGVIESASGDLVQGCLVFTSTKLKAYKKWNSTVNACLVAGPNGSKVKPPRYAHLVKVSSKRTKNTKGTFFIPILEAANGDIRSSLLQANDERFIAAKALGELVAKGVAKVSEEAVASAAPDADNDGPF